MKRIALVIAPLTIFLVACGDPASSPGTVREGGQSDTVKIDVSGDSDTHLYRVKMGNEECIVADGYQSVALSCNWNNNDGMMN